MKHRHTVPDPALSKHHTISPYIFVSSLRFGLQSQLWLPSCSKASVSILPACRTGSCKWSGNSVLAFRLGFLVSSALRCLSVFTCLFDRRRWCQKSPIRELPCGTQFCTGWKRPGTRSFKKTFRKASVGNKGCASPCADCARPEQSAKRPPR